EPPHVRASTPCRSGLPLRRELVDPGLRVLLALAGTAANEQREDDVIAEQPPQHTWCLAVAQLLPPRHERMVCETPAHDISTSPIATRELSIRKFSLGPNICGSQRKASGRLESR